MYIAPIFKKGNPEDTNNYRGITLTNIVAKIYSHVLNNRLTKWSKKHEKLTSIQFGFQPNKSTIDCIYIFHAIIMKTLNSHKKLFCAFVDFSKAFDKIQRDLLWFKLVKEGVSNRMFKAIQAMYKSVKSVIRNNNVLSENFEVFHGVKQGNPLSPILFLFFINDLPENIKPDSHDDLFTINELHIFTLLYADDAVLFAHSKDGLQKMLDKLSIYCTRWKLKVNTEKTKIMIFERGRARDVDIYYNGIKLDIVDCFKYLGITFYNNGNWFRTQKLISQYGNFALHKLVCLFESIYLPITEKCKLFDCLVESVLSYGSEVWGFHEGKDIENVHTKFCKQMLCVKRSTNSIALYGELGRIPLWYIRKICMVKYWLNILSNRNSLMYKFYEMLHNDLSSGLTYSKKNWDYQV